MNRSSFECTPARFNAFSRFILVALFLGAFLLPVAAAETDDNAPPDVTAPKAAVDDDLPIAELTDQLFTQVKTQKPDACWQAVSRLVRLGEHNPVVTDRLERELLSNDFKSRLVAARALCQLNNIDRAAGVLTALVEKGETAEARRLAANAIGLTGSLYNNEPVIDALAAALKTESDELTRISIARSLWRIASGRKDGKEALLQILNQAQDKAIKDEAALVLAENGSVALQEVRVRLLNLYSEPTAAGERAFNLLRHAEEESTRVTDSKVVQGEQLMRELLRTIRAAYPDESKIDLDRLFEDAAKGMVAGLDPFSQYMDREEVKATQEMLQQDYGGIGAYVVQRNNNFVVVSPIYNSPADRAGLRAQDIIQEVDGIKANELLDKGGMNTVIARLKGPAGTPVRVKFWRRGFVKSVELTIVRENIRIDSVTSAMLPAQIGYVKLTRFGEHSADEMQKALDTLFKDQHARGVIFDLRDNPGGLLRAGVDIADKFLAADKLIVYSEGNKDFAPRKPYMSTGIGSEDFPMVVLVGGGSASASEIVAGALQDHKRAQLIGEKTFGKGSVQQIMPVKTTERQTQLRLTVAKYYLPTGRCIHEKGIDPDVEVKQPETPSWVVEKILELRRQSVFDDYVRDHWETNKGLFERLALSDDKNPQAWPDFDAFFKGLNTKLEPSDVRTELRLTVRRRVQDEQKREMVYDFEEDDVLQRGALEVVKALKLDPAQIAEYKMLPEKFNKKKDEPAQEGAMLPEAAPKTPP